MQLEKKMNHRIFKSNNLIHLILLQKGYYPLKWTANLKCYIETERISIPYANEAK